MRRRQQLNTEQKRMMYLRKIYNSLVSKIFIDQEEKRFQALELIAQENQKLLNCNTPTFLFDGQWCPYTNIKPSPEWNKELHSSLREKVSKIFYYTDFDDQDIQAGVQSLIINALALARVTEDITRLLPQQLIYYVGYIDPDIFDNGDPLTEEEIAQFHQANTQNLAYLKRMLITQLLMSKT